MEDLIEKIKDKFELVLWGFLVVIHTIAYVIVGEAAVALIIFSLFIWYGLAYSPIGRRLRERIETNIKKVQLENEKKIAETEKLKNENIKIEEERNYIKYKKSRETGLYNAKMKVENYKLTIRERAESAIKDDDLRGDKLARNWYSQLIAEAKSIEDESLEKYLKNKKRPAIKTADQVKNIKNEKKEVIKKLKVAEYQLKLYEENFPIIEDLKDYLLENDQFMSIHTESSDIDPAKKYLKPEDYEKLSTTEKNQKALNNYINRNHSKLEIGRFYERYIGFLYEKDGWKVKYFGIIEGFDDLGRDLICSKDDKIEIVQTKNWAKHKTIREKYIYQHFATTVHYKLQNKINKNIDVKSKFISTIDCSEMAKEVCKALDIDYEIIPFSKEYPMIKCNINPSTKEKIYHLPFDQQYDKIIIGDVPGEKYLSKIYEAEAEGFRRAFRYKGGYNS